MGSKADYLEYRIKPGDNLTRIIGQFYDTRPSGDAYSAHLNQIVALNPHIRNPDMIHAGTILRLMARPASVAAVTPLNRMAPPHSAVTAGRLPLPAGVLSPRYPPGQSGA